MRSFAFKASQELGSVIREQCSGKNKDLKKLAKHLGINGWQLARRLSGAKPFTIDELVEAAKWLEIPIGALLSATSLGQPRVM